MIEIIIKSLQNLYTFWRNLSRLQRNFLIGFSLILFLFISLTSYFTNVNILQLWLQALIAGQSPWAKLNYILITAILMCLFIPRQALSFVGGVFFGGWQGALLATLGCTLGCALAMSLARWLGRDYLERNFTDQLQKINNFLLISPIIMSFNLRLVPTGNSLLFCFLGGLSQIPASSFILGSGLGYLPQNFIFSFLGSGLSFGIIWQVLIGAGLFCLACGLSYGIYKKYSRQL